MREYTLEDRNKILDRDDTALIELQMSSPDFGPILVQVFMKRRDFVPKESLALLPGVISEDIPPESIFHKIFK